jgi:hypothetical protein
MRESENARLNRKKLERQQYLRRQAEREARAAKALEEAADADPQVAGWLDYDMEQTIASALGISYQEIQAELSREVGEDVSAADVTEAQRVIQAANRVAHGGIFRRGNKKKAAEMVTGSNAVKKVAASAKKRKSCLPVLIGLLGLGAAIFGSAVYGAAQVFEALGR